MVHFLYPQIAQEAKRYLMEEMSGDTAARSKGSNWSKEEGHLNKLVFSVLKTAYLPLVKQKLDMEEYQEIV